MSKYIFAQENPRENHRLTLLENYVDSHTKAFLDAVQVGPGQTWAEVGVGAGSIASWLADRVQPRGVVHGYDVTFRNFSAEPKENLHLEVLDLARTPIPLGAFDGIHCRFVLLHLPDRALALKRFVNGLKVGGILILTESDCSTWTISSNAPNLRVARDAYLEFGKRAGWDLQFGARVHDLLLDSGLDLVESMSFRTTATGHGIASSLVGEMFRTLRAELIADGNIDAATLDRALHELRATSTRMTYVETTIAGGRRPAPLGDA